ncbi:hypothetical protein BS78_K137800 [Paspalum vaginatum]|uniref:F-box domain-containing protein n=1 Tax=Paspalum vaginatum TaxID=158149 RepID=A0A9W7XBJ5_9POAL|nr:hypothetical protein BS78_K137800 [Paspalum vaginatum]
MDMSALLPDDVLAVVLGLVAPRDLAVSRSVCKAWHAVVDDYRILRTELLPRSLADGGKRDFLADGSEIGSWSEVQDHCNGLLLTERYDEHALCDHVLVLNQATGWRAPVPLLPQQQRRHYRNALSQSSHRNGRRCVLRVFSSVTGRWEERPFVRVGEGAGASVADMRRYGTCDHRYAVYRRGRLYIHCQTDFVMRISLSNGTYQVIKPPAGAKRFYLGKSGKGVYCASITHGTDRYRKIVRVWILNENETRSPLEWVLKHDQDILPLLRKHKLEAPGFYYKQQVPGPWVLLNINYYYDEDVNIKGPNIKGLVKEEFEWSSDASDDETASERSVDSDDGYFYCGYFQILGFHPYKEIVFLCQSQRRGLTYHLNSSTLQELGNIYPEDYDYDQLPNEQNIDSSFPYTPCWI